MAAATYDMPPPQPEDSKYLMAFSEQSIRSAFVKKVFILVTIMFTIVTLMCSIPMIFPGVGDWLNGSDGSFPWLVLVSCIVFIVVSIVLSCVTSLRRNHPWNLVLLTIFTLSAGVMTASITAAYTVESVLMCLAITSCCSASIVLFAIFIKKDLTQMIGIMFILGMCLFFFGITASIAIWACGVTFLYTLYSLIAAIFFMFWLAIDVQLIMGKGKYALSPEEHVFAAMQIFLDVLNIFLMLLNIFGKFK